MKKLNAKTAAKLRRSAGFTLVEMLIVVAIIAILIAVSIPLVQTSIEKSRDATDKANERAAKAEGALIYLGGGGFTEDEVDTFLHENNASLIYDAEAGKLVRIGEEDFDEPYGKCTANGCEYGTKNGGSHVNEVIYVQLKDDGSGEVIITWAPL